MGNYGWRRESGSEEEKNTGTSGIGQNRWGGLIHTKYDPPMYIDDRNNEHPASEQAAAYNLH